MILEKIKQQLDIKLQPYYDMFNEQMIEYNKQIDKVNAEIITNKLIDNDFRDYKLLSKIRDIKRKIEKPYSHICIMNYLKNEVSRIQQIENIIPKNIENLLSPYGTFYDGQNILYCNKNLSEKELLECIANHIAHYSLALYKIKHKDAINYILRFFAACGLLNDVKEYDYIPQILKYFNKIYRDEIKDIIIFEPNNKCYSKYILDLIKDNKLNYGVYYDNNYFIYKNITQSGIFNNIKNVTKSGRKDFYTRDFLDKYYLRSYETMDKSLKKLLLNNNIKIKKDGN